ncbi:RHS repeat-associated core domain-containing protein [Streptomyces althioticus]|uniref:RHS repeat-associated core domain-containing protein n=1 Tax=Streptomyces althioticus TaxID=83380 RepID=UPI0033CDEC86
MPRSTPTDAAPRPTRYAGAYADPTGLYKMGHRYYAPLGRFTQPDLSGQETNPYLYASGDPINNIGPLAYSISGARWLPQVRTSPPPWPSRW